MTCPICQAREAGDQLVDRTVHFFCCPECLPLVAATFAAYGTSEHRAVRV